MKKHLAAVIATLLLCAATGARAQEPGGPNPWIASFGFLPLGFTNLTRMEDLEATRGTAVDTFDADGLYSPSLFMGFDFDPAGGFGWDLYTSLLYHEEGITGSAWGADLALILPHPPRSPLRGRIKGGILGATINWDRDDTDVIFKDALGWQVGFALDVGRRVPFYVEAVYRSLKFDVDTGHSDAVNEDQLDLSGPVISLGVKFNIY